jgi:short-subunit dehydrogenase
MSSKVSHKVVLITGASSGIGRAVALQFAKEKAHIVLVARRKQLLETVAEEIMRIGGQALVIPADVADRQQVEVVVCLAEKQLGRIDVLVNNAGFGVYGSVNDCTIDDFEKQIEVNYLGAVYFTKAVLPQMCIRKSGVIINVSSICGIVYTPLDSGYCASKFALNAFTNILRRELMDRGISVCLICPGSTQTEWESAVVQRHARTLRRILSPMSSELVAETITKCARKPKHLVIMPRMLKLQILAQFLFPSFYEWFYFKFHAPRPPKKYK